MLIFVPFCFGISTTTTASIPIATTKQKLADTQSHTICELTTRENNRALGTATTASAPITTTQTLEDIHSHTPYELITDY